MINSILIEIKKRIEESIPSLSKEQKIRMYKILNSRNPNFKAYGIKMNVKELIAKDVYKEYSCSYLEGIQIFKELIKSNIEDEQFIGIYFLNNFKKQFNEVVINIIHDEYLKNCSTWSLCDSTCIKIIGPFLGKKENEELALKIIKKWSSSKNLWIRRGSIVILIKIVILKKDFFISKDYIFELVEKMLDSGDEDYILKGVGWLLKTCSNYKQTIIIEYLKENKNYLPQLVLRYATEKMPKNIRSEILSK
ncbi:MAG: DNA alkylation repair protein [Candidatus Lokiarchaeota archaeon]|nr:DNA alkylation repair protein [Candidatus Lokiarchaeota archaeon]